MSNSITRSSRRRTNGGLGAARIGVIPDALSTDAGKRRIELGVADKEGIMPRPELFARSEIEGHAVRCLDRDEMAPFRPRFEIEDIGEEFGRDAASISTTRMVT